ncbi:GreA/GreB family elongation factor [uncultured Rubinisphaera sp.]|uniref:GreA/GreB family elongation factor n=1 Tax=uncultured Rubinisphaera sp. TaxID=1678686 RepID=UPI000ECAD107|nr:transcription elongation factor GreAB [Planctomycetaceae bacterium]|tara:strand:+ start:233 stop:652 length:420 start_codon:yes stop_codon:yes gene_type:complete
MTTKQHIFINKEDHKRLESLFVNDMLHGLCDLPHLRSLQKEIETASIVAPEEVPTDVVTVDSTVRLCDSRSSYEDTYTLVFPEVAKLGCDYLSVLSPIGTAIFGYRVGDHVSWPVPGGIAVFCIEELVFQPERDGVISN